MTGTHQRLGDAAPADGSAGLEGVVPARERAEPPPLPATAWANVVPFVRPRSATPPEDSAPAVAIGATDRPAPNLADTETRPRLLALIAASLAVHAGLYLATNREPTPMASVGLEAISVELVLGANSPAGAGAAPSKEETQTAPTEPQQAEPHREVQDQKPPDQMAAVPPEDTPQTPPEQPQPREAPQPAPVAEAPAERTPEAPVAPEPIKPEAPVARPAPVPVPPQTVPPQTVPPRPRQEAKPPPAPKAAPKQAPKPAPKQEAKPRPEPKRDARPAPARKNDEARDARRGKAAPRADTPGPRRNASNGAGAGSSADNANYRGLVSTHLARYKRFPPEAQRSGSQGAATVSFSISGSGSVTGVSLVRGTGVAALDQEAVAMVRRASPFPAPPDGRPQRFTVPVSYRVH